MNKLDKQLGRDLTSLASDKLIKKLKEYGNQPSDEHIVSLYKLLDAYTHMAQGVLTGRWAFPLPTGAGKTLSVVAWIAALYEILIENISLAVCASKVEALCDLKRDLISMGVPEDMIGLLHSYTHNPERAGEPGYASLPCTKEHDQKQILLITHNRVRGKGDLEQYHLFKGKPRDILFWDESLLISEARSVSEIELESALGWLKPKLRLDKGESKRVSAFKYAEKCLKLFKEELDSQEKQDRPAIPVYCPPLSPPEVKEFKEALGNNSILKCVKDLLEISQNPLRVVNTDQSGGFIRYDIVVPAELENIIILVPRNIVFFV